MTARTRFQIDGSTSKTCTTGPPRRMRVAQLDREVAAGDVHGDALADQAATVRDRGGRARAGAAAQGLPHAALPDPHVELVGRTRRDADELDVGALREALVGLEVRAVLGDARGGGVVDEQHEVRVPHPGGVALVVGAVEVGADAERRVGRHRDLRGIEGDRAHVDGGGSHCAVAVTRELDLATTAAGVDDERAVGAEAVARRDPGEGAHAVAAHLGDAAVGVVEHHLGVGAVACRASRRSGRRRRCRCGGRRARAPAPRSRRTRRLRDRATTTRGSRCRWRAAWTAGRQSCAPACQEGRGERARIPRWHRTS